MFFNELTLEMLTGKQACRPSCKTTVKARHGDSLRAASASGKWSWPVATAALSTSALTRIAPPRVDDRGTYFLVAGHMIYEQACRTPWQHLLARSVVSVKVRVPLTLLRACFTLLFRWKWCPSRVVWMLSSFWMCMRNLRVFGISDIPITTIKLNAIIQCWNWWANY
jgi:hypothetical protein